MSRPRIRSTVTPPNRPDFLAWCAALGVSRLCRDEADKWASIKAAWAASGSSQKVARPISAPYV